MQTKGCEDIIGVLFHSILQVKLYHWQTTSFSRHKATDTLFADIVALSDTFIETFIGRYKRPQFPEGLDISIQEISDADAVTFLQEFANFLRKELPKYLKSSDADLLNIRDEMLGKINQTLYLFTLQ